MILRRRMIKAGFSYESFVEFVNSKPASKPVNNYDGRFPSWNECIVGEYLRSIGIIDDFSSSKRNNIITLNQLFHDYNFSLKVHSNLNRGNYSTYGEVQEDIIRYTEPLLTLMRDHLY